MAPPKKAETRTARFKASDLDRLADHGERLGLSLADTLTRLLDRADPRYVTRHRDVTPTPKGGGR